LHGFVGLALALLIAQCMKTILMGILCLIFGATAGWAQSADDKSAPRVGAEKIKHLEQKARNHDMLLIKNRQLEAELIDLRTQAVPSNAPSGRSRLEDMEWKAQHYNAMLRATEQKDKKIVELEEKLAESEKRLVALQSDMSSFNSRMAALSNMLQEAQANELKLKATVEQLVLGHFEYYEVKRGDTIESIAEKPMIYNDASKAAWLRQANRGKVKDMDHLTEGEMLIIPRFFSSDLFAF
jgi:chaperonin cofactor prefoldin